MPQICGRYLRLNLLFHTYGDAIILLRIDTDTGGSGFPLKDEAWKEKRRAIHARRRSCMISRNSAEIRTVDPAPVRAAGPM